MGTDIVTPIVVHLFVQVRIARRSLQSYLFDSISASSRSFYFFVFHKFSFLVTLVRGSAFFLFSFTFSRDKFSFLDEDL